MTAVDVTIIDQATSERSKRELATRLTNMLVSHGWNRQSEEQQRWREVACLRVFPALRLALRSVWSTV